MLGNEDPAVLQSASPSLDLLVYRIFCTEGTPKACEEWAAYAAQTGERLGVPVLLRYWIWRDGIPHASPGQDCSDVEPLVVKEVTAAMLRHTAGRLWGYQLENEPDSIGCDGPARYASRVVAAATQIRLLDPGAKIVLGGIAGPAVPWLEGLWPWLMAYGCAPGCVDAVAVHDYTNDPGGQVTAARLWLDAHYSHGVGVLETELGAAGDGLEQAELVTKRLASCRRAEPVACVVYRLQDEAPGGFGLWRHDGTPKPAWGALR